MQPISEQLVPIRYYTSTDVYHYTTDNRPLQDLATNIGVVAGFLSSLEGNAVLENPGGLALAAGAILEWGIGTNEGVGGRTVQVPFNNPFPNGCLGVWVQDMTQACIPFSATPDGTDGYTLFIPPASIPTYSASLEQMVTGNCTWWWVALGF